MALVAKMILNILIDYTSDKDLGIATYPLQINRGITLTNGTGANKGTTLYDITYTIADGGNEEIQIADGSLTDSLGQAVSFDILRGLYIKNNSEDATLIVGAAAATQLAIFGTPATDTLLILPGGENFWTAPNAAGLDVTTNEDLKLVHDGTGSSTMDVDLIIVGEN